MPAPTTKVFLADWLRDQLPLRKIESICDEVGIEAIGEGHLLDRETVVELDTKGCVVTVGGVRPIPRQRTVVVDE